MSGLLFALAFVWFIAAAEFAKKKQTRGIVTCVVLGVAMATVGVGLL